MRGLSVVMSTAMAEVLKTLGFLLTLVSGPLVATAGYIVTIQLARRTGLFTTGEEVKYSLVDSSLEFRSYKSKSAFHRVLLHVIAVLGMVVTFALFVMIMDVLMVNP